jgi:hypothetical protein
MLLTLFWLWICALILGFTILLALKLEDRIGIGWYELFSLLWVALLIYFGWIWYMHKIKPWHWFAATAAVGTLIFIQSVFIAVALDEHQSCGFVSDSPSTGCARDLDCGLRRKWAGIVLLSPVIIIESVALIYIIVDYVWIRKEWQRMRDAQISSLIDSTSKEWVAAQLENDARFMEELDKMDLGMDSVESHGFPSGFDEDFLYQ